MQTNKTTNVILGIIAIALAAIIIILVIHKNSPRNSYIQDSGMQTQQSVSLDTSNPAVQTYKTAFTEAFAQPADFDEHYKVVEIGCGSACISVYAIDKNTGNVYAVPHPSEGNNPLYKLDNNELSIYRNDTPAYTGWVGYFMEKGGFVAAGGTDAYDN